MMNSPDNREIIAIMEIETADGVFLTHYSKEGLAGLNFPQERNKTVVATAQPPEEVLAWHKLTVKELENVLAGKEMGPLPPLDLSVGTDFQRSVWQQLLKIPPGETKSYADLARALRNPRAFRAVGGACGANPIPVLIPCHRVLAAGGKIGGFSSPLAWKRRLLGRELKSEIFFPGD